MVVSVKVLRRAAMIALCAPSLVFALAPALASGASGFGPLSGPGGCLAAPGTASAEKGTAGCGAGKGLVGANSVAVSPDGANVYVASGTAGASVATSFGSVAILKRNPATGALSEAGCLSSDGTDGRDGASGACTPIPSLLGAHGIAVSPDGETVFVSSNISGGVVAFARNPATGLLTRIGCFQAKPQLGSGCTTAHVFAGSSALVTSADSRALYVASPAQGSVSTFTTATVSPSSPAPSAPAPGAAAVTVASVFGAPPTEQLLANPCIGVNGLDGACAVGVATQGLGALLLSPDGKQVYGAAPASHAVDVFTPDATGSLAQSGCLKLEPPPGLCGGGELMSSPSELAASPDGKNVYAADSSEAGGGQVDVLSRNPSTGALTDASCLDFLRVEEHEEKGENEEGEQEPEEEGEPGVDRCTSVAGLENVSVVAVSGDGSAVYAIGSGSAAIFSRDAATGQLTEASCAASEDNRCTSLPALEGVEGAAVSTDGREVYVAASGSDAVMVFGVGAAVSTGHTSATRAGIARLHVDCPRSLRSACVGRLALTRLERVRGHAVHGSHRHRLKRTAAGHSAPFTISPGGRATIAVHLSAASRKLLAAHRRLRVLAVVHAAPSAGGSGYGRRVLFSLGGH
jgi:DNA-binding beta-propeller fold protein YncE